MPYKRTNARRHFQQECFLSNGLGDIKSRIVNVSKMGVGVWVNEIISLKKGHNLFIKAEHFQDQFLAQVRWIKKNVNSNTSRLGLQLSTGIIED